MPTPVIDERTGHFKSRKAAGVSLLVLAAVVVLVLLFFSPLFV